MGRPRKQNPKNRHIGIVTTEEKFRRFKSLGLVGDEAIDILLYHLENEKIKQNIKKSQIIRRIKYIDKEVEELEFEKLKLETKLEEINLEIGVNAKTGLNRNIDSALRTVIDRWNKSIYPIEEFIQFNENLIANQAYLAGVSVEEFKELIYEHS